MSLLGFLQKKNRPKVEGHLSDALHTLNHVLDLTDPNFAYSVHLSDKTRDEIVRSRNILSFAQHLLDTESKSASESEER